MLLFYLAPVWGVLGGRIFFGEPLTRLRVARSGNCRRRSSPAAWRTCGARSAAGHWSICLRSPRGCSMPRRNLFTRAAESHAAATPSRWWSSSAADVLSSLILLGTGEPLPALAPGLLGQLLRVRRHLDAHRDGAHGVGRVASRSRSCRHTAGIRTASPRWFRRCGSRRAPRRLRMGRRAMIVTRRCWNALLEARTPTAQRQLRRRSHEGYADESPELLDERNLEPLTWVEYEGRVREEQGASVPSGRARWNNMDRTCRSAPMRSCRLRSRKAWLRKRPAWLHRLLPTATSRSPNAAAASIFPAPPASTR